jgi:hypothetical protein
VVGYGPAGDASGGVEQQLVSPHRTGEHLRVYGLRERFRLVSLIWCTPQQRPVGDGDHALHNVGVIHGPEALEERTHNVEVASKQLDERFRYPVTHEAVRRRQQPAQRDAGQLDHLGVVGRIWASRCPAGQPGCRAEPVGQLVVRGEPEVAIPLRHPRP